MELRGKTLGIAGMGRIGAEVARRARALEMRVIAYDPFVSPGPFSVHRRQLCSLDELLAESDFITLHVPLTAANHHFLDEAQFAQMKPGVRVLNVARGELISEKALVRALDSGRVAGAAIDVFEKEPPDPDSPLLHHPNVIVTPHLGASAAEAQERVSVDVADQLLAALRGEPVVYAVNSPMIAAEAFKVVAPYLQTATQAGSLATQLSTGQFESVEIEYVGEIVEHDTTPIRSAVIRGLLSPISDENVTLVNASLVAEQRGLKITERKGAHEGIYKDLIRVHLHTSAGETSVSATVAHDGPHIVEINDFWVDVSPGEGYLLFCENVDRPGMIGRIGTFLGTKDINISFMRVGPSNGARPRAYGAWPGRCRRCADAGRNRRHPRHLHGEDGEDLIRPYLGRSLNLAAGNRNTGNIEPDAVQRAASGEIQRRPVIITPRHVDRLGQNGADVLALG